MGHPRVFSPWCGAQRGSSSLGDCAVLCCWGRWWWLSLCCQSCSRIFLELCPALLLLTLQRGLLQGGLEQIPALLPLAWLALPPLPNVPLMQCLVQEPFLRDKWPFHPEPA